MTHEASSGTKIADAIDNVRGSIDRSSTIAETVVETAAKTVDAGAMGIKGVVLNNIGNIAAMAIIAFAFIYLQREQVIQAREDRVMFRESIKAFNDSADRRYEKAEAIQERQMEKMGNVVERAVVSMEGATKELREASRKINP